MQLVDNWQEIAKRAHSMWAQYLGIGALISPEIIYLMFELDTNPKVWFWTGLALMIYGTIGRLVTQGIDQTTLRSSSIAGIAAIALVMGMTSQRALPDPQPHIQPAAAEVSPVDDIFLAVAVPLIAKWEGLRLEAYQDIVGVWTVCYGETRGVKRGDRYTKAECDAMLAHEVLDFRDRLRPALTKDTVANRLPVARDAAFTSVAYNVGVGAFRKSTAVRRLNGGDIAGACQALTWWNKAGGRVIRGLVNRRKEERILCLSGVV